ncbi:MAG: nucleoside-diphosphate kinase [Bacteroidetes bacterium]|nr:nucleoside-diphosphate kinase [Bacteroidota bacterium]
MADNKTLTIIKPDAMESGYLGEMLTKIQKAGFEIKEMKLMRLSEEDAKSFYEVHTDKPFYTNLVKFMSSGPIVPMILEKENAVEDFRELIGATNPADAKEGTIRNIYATNIERNAIHGSDSDENAAIEGAFFFEKSEWN